MAVLKRQNYSYVYTQGNESHTGIAARDTASALRVLTAAARGVAATSDDKALQMNLIKATQAVVAESAKLIQEAKNAMANPGDPNNQPKLAQVRILSFIFLLIINPRESSI